MNHLFEKRQPVENWLVRKMLCKGKRDDLKIKIKKNHNRFHYFLLRESNTYTIDKLPMGNSVPTKGPFTADRFSTSSVIL